MKSFKSHFSTGHGLVHFNSAGQCLVPDVFRNEVSLWLKRFYEEGALCSLEGWNLTEVIRAKLAQFLNADTSEVAFFQTTASALSQAALRIPICAGDEVLIWDQEYPSNFYPWREACFKNNAKLIQVESDKWKTPAEKILDRVSDKTKVIAISWVQFQTGSVTDLKKISQELKEKNIWLVADVIQGVGVRPFDFKESGFDIVCGGSHKWLCSGYGAGYMIVRSDKMQSLDPLEYGAMTFGMPETAKSMTLQPKTDARRYEPGSKSMFEIIGLGATLDLFTKFGVDSLFKESSRLGNKLSKGLTELGYHVISDGPIVNFYIDNINKQNEMTKRLNDSKVSYALRGPGIRFSVHAYNHDHEVENVLNILNF